MAAIPYLIIGNVRRGPLQDYTEVNTTIVQADGGATVDLFLSSGIRVAASLTITLRNVTNSEVATVTTDANGDYSFDANNWTSGYADGDSIRISATTVDTTARTDVNDSMRTHKTFQTTANAWRELLSDRRGNEFTENYPLQVELQNNHLGEQNPSWVATYSSGLIATETVTIKGVQYRKTYTWASGNLTNETAWVIV